MVCLEYSRAEPEIDWSYPSARRRAYKRVHAAIKQMYRLTGDPRWNPQGHQGHERLRQQILKLDLWSHDLQ